MQRSQGRPEIPECVPNARDSPITYEERPMNMNLRSKNSLLSLLCPLSRSSRAIGGLLLSLSAGLALGCEPGHGVLTDTLATTSEEMDSTGESTESGSSGDSESTTSDGTTEGTTTDDSDGTTSDGTSDGTTSDGTSDGTTSDGTTSGPETGELSILSPKADSVLFGGDPVHVVLSGVDPEELIEIRAFSTEGTIVEPSCDALDCTFTLSLEGVEWGVEIELWATADVVQLGVPHTITAPTVQATHVAP